MSLIFKIKTIQLIKEKEIISWGCDDTLWNFVQPSWKTCTVGARVFNDNGVLFTVPVAAILHKNSTEKNFFDIFSALRVILKNLSGIDLKAEYLVTDQEPALFNGFLTAFNMSLRLPCMFHKSQNLRLKFIDAGYKKLLDQQDPNPIKNLFKGLKKVSLFPIKKALALIEIFEGRIMITKFDEDPEIDDKHKTNVLKIIYYLKKQLISRGSQPSWLDIIQNRNDVINCTNNDIESLNKKLKARTLRYRSTTQVLRLMGHKRAFFEINKAFQINFMKSKYQRKKNSITEFNNDLKIELAKSLKDEIPDIDLYSKISLYF